MTEPSLAELIFGPIEEGQGSSFGYDDLDDIMARLDTVQLTTPVHPLADKVSALTLIAREQLRALPAPSSNLGPLTMESKVVEWNIRKQLELYIEPDKPRADRLYVLEFQGPWQYIMFGHSTSLLNRVSEHQRAASPHGFALLNGWASPALEKAQLLEQHALFYAGLLHHTHHRERFYQMPFEKGLQIVRIVIEKLSDWPSRASLVSAGRATPR